MRPRPTPRLKCKYYSSASEWRPKSCTYSCGASLPRWNSISARTLRPLAVRLVACCATVLHCLQGLVQLLLLQCRPLLEELPPLRCRRCLPGRWALLDAEVDDVRHGRVRVLRHPTLPRDGPGARQVAHAVADGATLLEAGVHDARGLVAERGQYGAATSVGQLVQESLGRAFPREYATLLGSERRGRRGERVLELEQELAGRVVR